MHAEHSLRSRFLWAQAGVVVLLVAVFAAALGLFVDVLEDELAARVVSVELHKMPGHGTYSPESSTDQAGGLRRWTVPVDDQRGLPAPLRRMPEGVREITWDDGLQVFAGKVIVDGRVHAVVADIQNVERLEQRLLEIGVGTLLVALLLSLLIATWLSRIALRPISGLVERLGRLDPASPQPLLVTDLQTTEARLIATAVDGYQERLTRLLTRERSLTDDISHELRTPTSVITTASELLLDDPTVVGVARERVARIARATRRTGAVVEALLFLGRDDSINATVVVDLQTVVNETVDVYRPLARAKGLVLQVECSGEQLITAPPGTASIVLQNLLENAIRFTDHGSVGVLLEPGRMAVEDTGVGLSGVDRSRIFERGYRSDASPGSGLGLDLIRRVCDRVGWQAVAHERPTGGSRFEVMFRQQSET
jgi:signal transduction histidine kinase